MKLHNFHYASKHQGLSKKTFFGFVEREPGLSKTFHTKANKRSSIYEYSFIIPKLRMILSLWLYCEFKFIHSIGNKNDTTLHPYFLTPFDPPCLKPHFCLIFTDHAIFDRQNNSPLLQRDFENLAYVCYKSTTYYSKP